MHDLQANYEKTLLLLAALKAGTIGLDDFKLTDGGWNLTPKAVAAEPIPPDGAGE